MTDLPRAGQNRVFVIAEIASCHGGDRQAMSEAIHVATEAGADAIKFQWTSSPERLAVRRQAKEYLWAYRTLAFPQDWLAELKGECDGAGIEFMCTVYLPEDVPVIVPLVQRFKVASFEAVDEQFLNGYLDLKRPILVSLGAMDEATFWRLKGWWAKHDRPERAIQLLHCVSAYPTPMGELNLLAMTEVDGLSDHTANVLTGALAATLGASIIEVHFRLGSTDSQNPDYLHSLTPPDLIRYITNVRLAEAALGDGEKRVMPSERKWVKYRVVGGAG